MLSHFDTIEVGNIDHGIGMVRGQTLEALYSLGSQPLLIVTPLSFHLDTVTSHLTSIGSVPLSEIMLPKPVVS